MPMKIRKAVIPVAGYGTRFLPYTKAVPKEMLPIVDKPIIQFVVEEAVKSGIEEIIFITASGKHAIENYFDYNLELEQFLKEKGKSDQLQMVRKMSDQAQFFYVRQKQALGNGDAVLLAEPFIGKEPFMVMWGDEFVESKKPATAQLIEAFEKVQAPVINMVKAPKDEFESWCSRYGCLDGTQVEENIYKVNRIVEKPDPADAPSDLFAIGRYLLMPEIFDYLKKLTPGKSGEIWLVDALDAYKKDHPIYGAVTEGTYWDTGNKQQYAKAFIHFAEQLLNDNK